MNLSKLDLKIEEVHSDKGPICEKILRSLPMWFGIESAIVDYIKDVQTMPMLIASTGSEIVGFVSLNKHNKKTAEIHVMAVLESYHRQKVGKALVEAAETYLEENQFKFLSVKTLSESRPNEEYDKTRNFYLAMGFSPVEEFKTLWGEHNPCLLLIKTLNAVIAHTILYVSDQKRSCDFYSSVLKLKPILDVPGMTEFKLSENHILGLMPEAGIKRLLGNTIGDFSTGSPRTELYLHVSNPEEIFLNSIRLGAKELSLVSNRDWGDRAGYVMDFDGNVLAFAASLR
ncbi:MAG: GNAT family N-acetyltransferase [Bdellovibrionaceae bacterium]|nr:GNAT family N-acetyltransferase [Pseudobdellovibrionaceae bacterium]